MPQVKVIRWALRLPRKLSNLYRIPLGKCAT